MALRGELGTAGYLEYFKHQYRRQSHVVERLSAATLREPVIPAEHQQHIRAAAVGKPCDTKSDIQSILRSLDHAEEPVMTLKRCRVDGLVGHVEVPVKWTAMYLERWKSIRAMLRAGEHEESILANEIVVDVASLFMRFSRLWDRWQPPQFKYERERWRFPERKHFPNFNFMFRVCFELLRLEYDPQEWPIPTKHKCLQRLEFYAMEMMRYYGMLALYTPKFQPGTSSNNCC